MQDIKQLSTELCSKLKVFYRPSNWELGEEYAKSLLAEVSRKIKSIQVRHLPEQPKTINYHECFAKFDYLHHLMRIYFHLQNGDYIRASNEVCGYIEDYQIDEEKIWYGLTTLFEKFEI